MSTLRILDYAWHQAHSYRLHALPADFWYMRSYYHGKRKVLWDASQRPLPANFRGAVGADEIHPGRFDLAISHLDQWCDRIPHRAMPYRRMGILARDIPRVAIMHGTPDDSHNRLALLRLMDDLPIVCNSHQAAEEWDADRGRLDRYGNPQFRAIIHGYDVAEFWSEPLDKRVIEAATVCSGGELSREYHGIPLLERLMYDVPLAWYGPTGNREWFSGYDGYREMLARTLIYFSPSRRAPMPGARTEAMLSGCCIVTVPGNDAERFIQDGLTGFVVRTFDEARDTLLDLLRAPEVAHRIGQTGREMARSLFGRDRYVADWLALMESIGVSAPTYRNCPKTPIET